MPPTREEIAEFLADDSDDAFAKVIDRLLDSPHYGERWGRHWLDVVRYADSNGADENYFHDNAYRYRNYVIDAFNRDLPYDQFVRQQLAGDLLAKTDDVDQNFRLATGTGFLTLGVKIIAEKDLVKKQADIVDEQIDTLGKAFLGLTLGCARCHDHKFDPIPTADYYALAGIFHSTSIQDRKLETSEYLERKSAYDEKLSIVQNRCDKLKAELSAHLSKEEIITREAEAFDRGNKVVIDTDKYGAEIGVVASYIDQGNEFEYDFDITKPGVYQVEIRYAAAMIRPCQLFVNGELVGDTVTEITGGWYPANQKWVNEGAITLREGKNTLRFTSGTMAHLDKLRLTRIEGEIDLIATVEQLKVAKQELDEFISAAPPQPVLMAAQDGMVQDVKIHLRGDHNSLGELEPRHFLSAVDSKDLKPLPQDESGRSELVDWLVKPDHPLTARVLVNRIWGWHFGKGLVTTPDNFGTMGARPSHPELLDYLTVQFIKEDWSIKKLHRQILLSSTWQMTSDYTGGQEADPGNELYWKTNIKRLEAEAIRDSMLAISGELDRTVGGPILAGIASKNLSAEDIRKNQEIYVTSPRRTVYLPVIRTMVYDMLTLYDFPNSSAPTGQRSSTTVPTQALMMMNSEFVTNQARVIAEKTRLASTESKDERINLLYEQLFARRPTEEEIDQSKEFLAEFLSLGSVNEIFDPEQEAWSSLIHTLLMSNEFIYLR
ncbi:MAG: DUF1553 domain-containing protein [Planctomycetaceae bacterium]